MSKHNTNTPVARAMLSVFGMNKPFTIDRFDIFCIDQNLLADPGTSDTKDHTYKGFVQRRSAVRRLINTAAAGLNGSSFQIVIDKEDRTKYVLAPWGANTSDRGLALGDVVKNFTKNRYEELQSLQRKTSLLLTEAEISNSPDLPELRNAHAMLDQMKYQRNMLQLTVEGLAGQYTAAANAAAKHVAQLMNRMGVPALPAPTAELPE